MGFTVVFLSSKSSYRRETSKDHKLDVLKK